MAGRERKRREVAGEWHQGEGGKGSGVTTDTVLLSKWISTRTRERRRACPTFASSWPAYYLAARRSEGLAAGAGGPGGCYDAPEVRPPSPSSTQGGEISSHAQPALAAEDECRRGLAPRRPARGRRHG